MTVICKIERLHNVILFSAATLSASAAVLLILFAWLQHVNDDA